MDATTPPFSSPKGSIRNTENPLSLSSNSVGNHLESQILDSEEQTVVTRGPILSAPAKPPPN